jgi:hypothetical protein
MVGARGSTLRPYHTTTSQKSCERDFSFFAKSLGRLININY